MVKVSVIIPVYNPGEFIRPCVSSLLNQTMPPGEFEAIFVDDGSTDETPIYLDQIAAEHPHFTAIHQENSGWPGKPRNVGLDAAQGEYVFFCDNDDWFGEEALERLYDYAHENTSDVAIGKMAGIKRPVPQGLFRTSKPRATLADTPLMDSLTPHKLFRREFLREHGIRFPEGRRRLEDHLFVVTCYVKAEVISVYADYVCYYHIRRPDAQNAALSTINWDGYFANLTESLEVVVGHTDPGPLRQRIVKRWLANEMVARLSGGRFRRLDPAEAEWIFRAAHDVAARYFTEDTVRLLPPATRPVARAILRGDFERVQQQARLDEQWAVSAVLLQQAWKGPVLQIAGVATLTNPSPQVDVTAPLAALVDPQDLPEVSRDAASVAVDVTERREGSRWPVPVEQRSWGQTVAFTADIDPATLAQGAQLPTGIWDLYLDLVVLGLRRRTRLTLVHARSGAEPALREPQPDQPEVAAYLTKKRAGLTLDVGLVFHPGLRPAPPAEAEPDPDLEQAARRLPELVTRLRRRSARRDEGNVLAGE